MIHLNIEMWPLLNEIFGQDKGRRHTFEMEAAEDSTLEELIRTLCESEPALSRFFVRNDRNEVCGASGSVSVVLNGRLINSLTDYRTRLQDGDRVVFVQGFAGG